MKKEKTIGVQLENVAVPEVTINHPQKDLQEESEGEIDYATAVPEVHIRKLKKEKQ